MTPNAKVALLIIVEFLDHRETTKEQGVRVVVAVTNHHCGILGSQGDN